MWLILKFIGLVVQQVKSVKLCEVTIIYRFQTKRYLINITGKLTKEMLKKALK